MTSDAMPHRCYYPNFKEEEKWVILPIRRKNRNNNSGRVKDYQDWDANGLSSKFDIQDIILEGESGRFYPGRHPELVENITHMTVYGPLTDKQFTGN